jgi:hypothetical protein
VFVAPIALPLSPSLIEQTQLVSRFQCRKCQICRRGARGGPRTLDEPIEAHPRNGSAWLVRFMVKRDLVEPSGALAELTQAIKLASNNMTARLPPGESTP